MDEFGLLARDFGFRPQGKSAPMAASRGIGVANPAGTTTTGSARSGSASSPLSEDFFGSGHPGTQQRNPPIHQDDDDIFFGGGVRNNPISSSATAFSYDPFFQDSKDRQGANSKSSRPSSTLPTYDKPVYDDDIFNGVPGVKSSYSIDHEDVFASMSSGAAASSRASPPLYEDDLLANLGQTQPVSNGAKDKRFGGQEKQDIPGFDDLIPGFGGSSSPQMRVPSETNHQQPFAPSTRSAASTMEDPFVVLEPTSAPEYSSPGMFTDPLEHINTTSGSMKSNMSAAGTKNDEANVFDDLLNSVPSFSSEIKNKESKPLETVQNTSSGIPVTGKEPEDKSSGKSSANTLPRKVSAKNNQDSHQTLFGNSFSDSVESVHNSGAPALDAYAKKYEMNSKAGTSKRSEHSVAVEDVWLTVSEIPLFTQPTSAPPPSRPPPAFVNKQAQFADTGRDASASANARRKVNDSSFSQSAGSYVFSESHDDTKKTSAVSSIDELEDFAMGQHRAYADQHMEALSSEEEIETNSAAAASAAKEAMDRAEAKFKHAREVRERERDSKFAKNRETAHQERDEKGASNPRDQELKERQERLNQEREQREREEEEKEQRRLEKEKEQELERDRARQAVVRANREARERAAIEARLKADRVARERVERAAVQRAAAEARERAAADAKERAERFAAEAREKERADVLAKERAAAEARERAAAEARDKAAAEARERAAVERAAAEVRQRAQRAAVERAAAEARERATAEARERAAAVAREKQNKNDDLESFFGMGVRANSAPRQRAANIDSTFDQMQNKGSSEGLWRTAASSSSNMRKANSVADDLSSLFGGASSDDFQEIEGESEERRRARLERTQRTKERAAKALAEKNERDMQTQRDQAERHRISEALDIEIKRWAAGKEGNLRALLSTLQYVLWPESGWQPVSLTDLITSASVKKVYRKATLSVHPDKVQQRGASLQQKYIAEKVFDLLKEAWNKFNSEELF